MGQHADDIIDGFVDEITGEIIDGESPGYPRRMRDAFPPIEGYKCPHCNRQLKSMRGVEDHIQAIHKTMKPLTEKDVKDYLETVTSNLEIHQVCANGFIAFMDGRNIPEDDWKLLCLTYAAGYNDVRTLAENHNER